jgi:hypothetical protein
VKLHGFVLAALLMPDAALAQSSVFQVDAREVIFGDAQKVCRLLLQSNAEWATIVAKSPGESLAAVCECAALLAVSSRTEDQILAIHEGTNQAVRFAFGADIKKLIPTCFQYKKMV